MKFVLLLIVEFFCFSSVAVFANHHQNFHKVQKSNNIDTLFFYAKDYLKNSSKNSIALTQKIILLSNQKRYKKHKANAYTLLAEGYKQNKQFGLSVEAFNKAIEYFEKDSNLLNIATLFSKIGSIYEQLGNFDKALRLKLKALSIRDSLKVENEIANSYGELGHLYIHMANFNKAKYYYLKALNIKEKLDNPLEIADVLNNLGVISLNKKEPIKAGDYFQKAYNLVQHSKNKNSLGECLLNLGLVNKEMKYYKSSLSLFQKSIEIKNELGDDNGIAVCYNYIGDIYKNTQRYDAAISSYTKSLTISKKVKNRKLIQNNFLDISNLYEKRGEFNKAYNYHVKFSSINDSIFSENMIDKIINIESLYSLDKKNKEIEQLARKKEIFEQAYKKNHSVFIFSLLVLALTILFIFIKYSNHKKLRETEKKALDDKLRLKADLTAMLVHDLRGPLTAMLSYSDLIKLQFSDEEIADFANTIYRSSQNMLNLVNDMLDISKFEAKQLEINVSSILIRELIEQALTLLKTVADDKKIVIVFTQDPKIGFIKMDPQRVLQVIVNLLGNAIKFSPQNSSIKVNAIMISLSGKPFMEVTVIDQGTGIATEYKELIFDKYAQIKNKENKVHVGTGLGLAVSKLILEAHKGYIGVRDAETGGAEFYFQLPAGLV